MPGFFLRGIKREGVIKKIWMFLMQPLLNPIRTQTVQTVFLLALPHPSLHYVLQMRWSTSFATTRTRPGTGPPPTLCLTMLIRHISHTDSVTYCMFKKSWHILYCKLRLGQTVRNVEVSVWGYSEPTWNIYIYILIFLSMFNVYWSIQSHHG